MKKLLMLVFLSLLPTVVFASEYVYEYCLSPDEIGYDANSGFYYGPKDGVVAWKSMNSHPQGDVVQDFLAASAYSMEGSSTTVKNLTCTYRLKSNVDSFLHMKPAPDPQKEFNIVSGANWRLSMPGFYLCITGEIKMCPFIH